MRPYFRELRELRDSAQFTWICPTCDLKELSMGMTHDFTVAIEEGATIVRSRHGAIWAAGMMTHDF